MTTFLPNNRQIQKTLETYKTKSEIDEALFLFKKHFSPIAYKVLKFILHTYGVTQADIKKICEAVDVSESYFHRVIKHEINEKLGEKIIRMIPTQKLDQTKTKKVRGCFYKVLLPLNKIKYLINKLEQRKETELQAFLEDLHFIPGVESSVDSSVKPEDKKPCESKAEDGQSESHLRSINKNLLEKDFNKLTITNFITKNFGKIKIKSEVKNYLNTFPLFRDFSAWTESKRYEIAKTIQFAIIKTETNIEEPKSQIMIKRAISRFMSEYADKPKNEFFRLLYTFVFNSLKKPKQNDSEKNEDHSEEYNTLVPQEIIEKKSRQEKLSREKSEEKIFRQDLDDLGVW